MPNLTLNQLSCVPTQYNYGSITLNSTLDRMSCIPTQYNYGSITLNSTLDRMSCIPSQCNYGSTTLKKHQWLNCCAANLDLSVLAEETGVVCNEAGLLGTVQEIDKHQELLHCVLGHRIRVTCNDAGTNGRHLFDCCKHPKTAVLASVTECLRAV